MLSIIKDPLVMNNCSELGPIQKVFKSQFAIQHSSIRLCGLALQSYFVGAKGYKPW